MSSELPISEGALANGTWQTCFRIRSYEVDFKRSATLEAICRRFLDAAWNHAEALEVGYTQLAQQQKFWVLSRLLVELRRYPEWGEAVALTTWPRPVEPLFALRDFEILDQAGRQLVGGVSAWLVLDARTRRPQRLDKLLTSMRLFPPKNALKNDPQKLPACAAGREQLTTRVGYSDIDVNRHVNSARYLGWVMDSYGVEFQRTHTAHRVELNYLAETMADETLSVHTQVVASERYFHSIKKAGGPEVCRAQLDWRAHAVP